MKWWLGLFVVMAVIGPLVFFLLVADSVKLLSRDDMPLQAVSGKQVWQREGCIECHSLFGNGGYSAPDLTHEMSEHGEEWLREFFLNPIPMRPHQSRKHSGLNWEDTASVIEYLRHVEDITVLGWPPEPSLKFGQKRGNGEGE